MAELEGHPWDGPKFYNKGANTDVDPDLLRGMPGLYRDAFNMRSTSINGTDQGLNKIKGTTQLHPSAGVTTPANYWLLAIVSVKGNLVEFWAPSDPLVQKPLIRVNGTIMAQSDSLPFTYDKLFQWDKSLRKGGYVMTTDYVVPPMIWDIEDIIENHTLNTGKYFDPFFNPALYTINLTAPLDIPVYRRPNPLEDVGSGGGLVVGQVAYKIRYGNNAGDKTNWSQRSPFISVPRNLDGPDSPLRAFPGCRLEGDEAALDSPTRYAPVVRFRANNEAGYDYIEVCRIEANDGVGINGDEKSYVVARIALAPDQFNIITFVDPRDSDRKELVPDDEEDIQLEFIKRAKGIRYIDNRVVVGNYEKQSKDITCDFIEVGGQKLVPITKDLGGIGYSDPINNTYYKSLFRYERHGWAVEGYDAVGGKSFSVPVPGYENYQGPQRRDEKAGDSLLFSDAPVYAGNNDGVVTPTFEAMEQGSRQKLGGANLVNVRYPQPYNPLTPTYAAQSQQDGNGYRVTIGVAQTLDGTMQGYNPAGYAPKYHALGTLLYGVDNLPDHIRAFQVVRTERAGVVVCQGLAGYAMQGANEDGVSSPFSCGKFTNSVVFWSNDLARGAVSEGALEDAIANPLDYEMIFTPTGWWSEIFNYKSWNPFGGSAPAQDQYRLGVNMDMLVHARLQWDDGSINPGQQTTGAQPPPGVPGANYVVPGVWRNDGDQGTGVFGTSGAIGIPLLSVTRNAQAGGATTFTCQLAQNIYQHTYPAPFEFNHPNTKAFHEPWYIATLIRKGATLPSTGQRKYVGTGCYVKRESLIGVITGQQNQRMPLVDERWEDVLPYLDTDYRYIWVVTPGGQEQAYLCVDINSTINYALVQLDINNNGFWIAPDGTNVYGLYAVDQTDGNYDVLPLQYGFVPPVGSKVYVRYDKTAPLRVFGGYATIAPSLMPYLNKVAQTTGTDDPDNVDGVSNGTTAFHIGGCPWPYGVWQRNPNYAVLRSPTVPEPHIRFRSHGVRQMMVLHDTENITPIHLASDDKLYDALYPKRNYVMRPNNYPAGITSAQNAGLHASYDFDYPDEYQIWGAGGFKWKPLMNLDYAREAPPEAFSNAGVGSQENTLFEHSLTYSMQASENTQGIPGWRTFFSRNKYTVDDNSGAIKRLYSANGPAGDNLYAGAHSGVVLLLTNKNILSGASGDEITTQSITNRFIGGQKWLSRTIGMPDELCFYAAEGHAPGGNGPMYDSLFFVNYDGAYRLTGDTILPIAMGKRLASILPILRNSGTDARRERAHGYYDPENHEYWFGLDRVRTVTDANGAAFEITEKFLVVYQVRTGEWAGEFGYRHHGYAYHDKKTVGSKFLSTENVGVSGYEMNGAPYTCWVENVHSPAEARRIEGVRVRIHSSAKPSQVDFGDTTGIKCTLNQGFFGPNYLKNVDGWEQNVPRKFAVGNVPHLRLQDTYLTVKVSHNLAEPFRIMSTALQFKPMK